MLEAIVRPCCGYRASIYCSISPHYSEAAWTGSASRPSLTFEGERLLRRMEEVYAAVLAGDRRPFPGGPYASASREAASLA